MTSCTRCEQPKVVLRAVVLDDLPTLFEHQCDAEACRMVVFTGRNREAFIEHWSRIMLDPAVITRTIVVDGEVAGNLLCFGPTEHREVGYWLGRDFWGRGIATEALALFLGEVDERPLVAHVAEHNLASRRVLEKCGFTAIAEDPEYGWLDGKAVPGLIFSLA